MLGVVGLGGSALAASSSGQARLQSAIDGAVEDRLAQLVEQVKLRQAQGDAIEKRLQRNGGMRLPGPSTASTAARAGAGRHPRKLNL